MGIGLIQTFTGRVVDPFALRVEDVHFDDIAGPLSRTCRFSGHTRDFLSVAQHSIMVSRIAFKLMQSTPGAMMWEPPGIVHAALMARAARLYAFGHDFAEAYLVDVPSPYKSRIQVMTHAEKMYQDGTERVAGHAFESFAIAEHRALVTIHAALGFPPMAPVDAAIVHDVVRHADLIALATEARDLMGPPIDRAHEWTQRLPAPLPERIVLLGPREAEAAFRARWAEVGP